MTLAISGGVSLAQDTCASGGDGGFQLDMGSHARRYIEPLMLAAGQSFSTNTSTLNDNSSSVMGLREHHHAAVLSTRDLIRSIAWPREVRRAICVPRKLLCSDIPCLK